MPKTFSSTFELDITPENEFLIQLLAEEFGWFPEMDFTPEQIIQKHFELFYVEAVRNRLKNRLFRIKGEAGTEEIEASMAIYDGSVTTDTRYSE